MNIRAKIAVASAVLAFVLGAALLGASRLMPAQAAPPVKEAQVVVVNEADQPVPVSGQVTLDVSSPITVMSVREAFRFSDRQTFPDGQVTCDWTLFTVPADKWLVITQVSVGVECVMFSALETTELITTDGQTWIPIELSDIGRYEYVYPPNGNIFTYWCLGHSMVANIVLPPGSTLKLMSGRVTAAGLDLDWYVQVGISGYLTDTP